MYVANNGGQNYERHPFARPRVSRAPKSPDNVASLQGQVQTKQGEVSELNSQKSEISGKITNAQEGIAQVNQTISSISGQMASFQSAVTAAAGALQSVSSMPDKIQTGTDENNAPIYEDNPQKAAQLASAQSAYEQAITALSAAQEQLRAAQTQLSQTEEVAAALNAEDSSIQGQLEAANQAIVQLQAQIQQAEQIVAVPGEDNKTQTMTQEPQEAPEPPAPKEPDKKSIDDAMLSEMGSELEKLKGEITADEDSKTGLGWAWNGLCGLVGCGTKGKLNDNAKLQERLDALTKSKNPDTNEIKKLYSEIFKKEPDIEAIKESIQVSEGVCSNEQLKAEITDKLTSQIRDLANGFDDKVKSQGLVSKIIGGANNFIGIGTTENMTRAQLQQYQKLADNLQNAKTPEEFSAAYSAITGESLSNQSLRELMGDESKVNNSKASESIISYEDTNNAVKNTAVAVGTGILVAATGPVGAVAIGAAMTVGVNAFDAVTQTNGKGPVQNLVNYAKKDLVKDVLVGGLNGLTGKLGNMAGDKLTSTLANKTLGSATATQVAEKAAQRALVQAGEKGLTEVAKQAAINNALKDALGTGSRILTELADGALDAALSSGGEYIISSAAGENGNFTDKDGKFSPLENLKQNFNGKEMLMQVGMSTAMGGVMSVGMQEGMRALGGVLGAKKAADALGDGNKPKVDSDALADAASRETSDTVADGITRQADDALASGTKGIDAPKGDVDTPTVKGDVDTPTVKGDVDTPTVKGDVDTPAVKGDVDTPTMKGDSEAFSGSIKSGDDFDEAVMGQLDELTTSAEKQLDELTESASRQFDDAPELKGDSPEIKGDIPDTDGLSTTGDDIKLTDDASTNATAPKKVLTEAEIQSEVNHLSSKNRELFSQLTEGGTPKQKALEILKMDIPESQSRYITDLAEMDDVHYARFQESLNSLITKSKDGSNDYYFVMKAANMEDAQYSVLHQITDKVEVKNKDILIRASELEPDQVARFIEAEDVTGLAKNAKTQYYDSAALIAAKDLEDPVQFARFKKAAIEQHVSPFDSLKLAEFDDAQYSKFFEIKADLDGVGSGVGDGKILEIIEKNFTEAQYNEFKNLLNEGFVDWSAIEVAQLTPAQREVFEQLRADTKDVLSTINAAKLEPGTAEYDEFWKFKEGNSTGTAMSVKDFDPDQKLKFSQARENGISEEYSIKLAREADDTVSEKFYKAKELKTPNGEAISDDCAFFLASQPAANLDTFNTVMNDVKMSPEYAQWLSAVPQSNIDVFKELTGQGVEPDNLAKFLLNKNGLKNFAEMPVYDKSTLISTFASFSDDEMEILSKRFNIDIKSTLAEIDNSMSHVIKPTAEANRTVAFRNFFTNADKGVEDSIRGLDLSDFGSNGTLPLEFSRADFASQLDDAIKTSGLDADGQKALYKKLGIEVVQDGDKIGYNGILNVNPGDYDAGSEIEQKVLDLARKFTLENAVHTGDEAADEAVNSLLKGFPELMNVIGKQQEAGKMTADARIFKTLQNAMSNPEYANLSDVDKTCLKLSAVFLNIAENEGTNGAGALASAKYVKDILEDVNLPANVKDRVYELVKNQNWLNELSDGRINETDVAGMFRRNGDLKIAQILAQSDLDNASEKALGKIGSGLKEMGDIQDAMQLINSKGQLLFTNKAFNKKLIPEVEIDGTKYKVVNLAQADPDANLGSIGFADGTKKGDVRLLAHMTTPEGIEAVSQIQDVSHESFLCSTYVSPDQKSTFKGQVFGVSLEAEKVNFANSALGDQGSGSGKSKNFSTFSNAISDSESPYRRLIPDGIQQRLDLSGEEYADLYSQIQSKPALSAIKDDAEFKVGDKVLTGKDVKKAIQEADDKLLKTTPKGTQDVMTMYSSYNEVNVYDPKINGFIIKADSLEEFAKTDLGKDAMNAMNKYMQKYGEVPIYLLGAD